MKIERITLRGVTKHAETKLDLPDRGVVLITGANGSGKSSLVEAVPLCLWGKTLRKADLWNLKAPEAAVEVVADGVPYTRKAKGRSRLAFGSTTYETTREAQAAIVDAHGPLDHWRRACVLSSADASNFTGATDAERKRLLEALTGVEKLEAGYRVALDRAKAKRREVEAEGRRIAVLEERVEGIRRRLADAVPPDDLPEPVEVDAERLATLRDALNETAADIRTTRDEIRTTTRLADAAKLESVAAEKERRRIDHDKCPTCAQPIPEPVKEDARRLVEEAERKAKEVADEVDVRVKALEGERVDLEGEAEDLNEEIRAAERLQVEAKSVEAQRQAFAKIDEIRKSATAELAKANAELIAAKQKHTEGDLEARTLEASARVLSTKGVRAHLLARTIAAVEAAANAWIGEIYDDRMRLDLKPYGTTKKGDTKDAVALSIRTTAQGLLTSEDDDLPADGREYASMSGGERRRIDVALCFALAEVAEAARGETGSTIFADEIFDALDVEGRNRVSEALRLLAEDRCVVVVAHEAAIDVRTVAAQHWHVVDGSIGRV